MGWLNGTQDILNIPKISPQPYSLASLLVIPWHYRIWEIFAVVFSGIAQTSGWDMSPLIPLWPLGQNSARSGCTWPSLPFVINTPRDYHKGSDSLLNLRLRFLRFFSTPFLFSSGPRPVSSVFLSYGYTTVASFPSLQSLMFSDIDSLPLKKRLLFNAPACDQCPPYWDLCWRPTSFLIK